MAGDGPDTWWRLDLNTEARAETRLDRDVLRLLTGDLQLPGPDIHWYQEPSALGFLLPAFDTADVYRVNLDEDSEDLFERRFEASCAVCGDTESVGLHRGEWRCGGCLGA